MLHHLAFRTRSKRNLKCKVQTSWQGCQIMWLLNFSSKKEPPGDYTPYLWSELDFVKLVSSRIGISAIIVNEIIGSARDFEMRM